MSIVIGKQGITADTFQEDKKRLFLSSSTYCNLVHMESSCNEVSMSFVTTDQPQQGVLTLGKESDGLLMTSTVAGTTTPLLRLANASNASYQPLRVYNTMTVTGLTTLWRTTTDRLTVTSNLTVNYPVQANASTPPMLSLCNVDGIPLMSVYPNGRTLLKTTLGINTTVLEPATYDLATAAGIYAGGRLDAQFVTTDRIVSITNSANKIFMSSGGKIRFEGAVELPQVTFNEGLTLKELGVDGRSRLSYLDILTPTYSNKPALSIQQSNVNAPVLAVYGCNTDISDTELTGYMVLTSNGCFGVGTMEPAAHNLFTVSCSNNADRLVVDRRGNVGIGTEQALHDLHIERSDANDHDQPTIGIYHNNDVHAESPFLFASCNGVPTVRMSSKGGLVLGDIGTSTAYSDYQVYVTSNAMIPTVFTDSLRATPSLACNIDACRSTLSNFHVLDGSHVNASNLSACNAYLSFVHADNFDIPGFFCCMDLPSMYSMLGISKSNLWFGGQKFYLGPDCNQMETFNPTTDGKLRISVPTVSGTSALGISMVGLGNGDIGQRITAYGNSLARYELAVGANTNASLNPGFLAMDSANKMFMAFSNDLQTATRRLEVNPSGVTVMSTANFTGTGLGINLGNIATSPPSYQLEVKGQALFKDNANNPSLFVSSSRSVGVRTTTPSSSYALDVNGDVNFTGALRTNGVAWGQWITVPGGIGTISACNLTIGSNVASTNNRRLTVWGEVGISSNMIVSGQVYTEQSIISVSDSNLKTELAPIDHALDRIQALQGYTYRRHGATKRETGLIAQEVQAVLPEAVFSMPSEQSDTGAYLSISYGNMAGLFVEAIRELSGRLEKAEKEIAELKSGSRS